MRFAEQAPKQFRDSFGSPPRGKQLKKDLEATKTPGANEGAIVDDPRADEERGVDHPGPDNPDTTSYSQGGAIDDTSSDPTGQDDTSDHVNAAMEAVHQAFQYGRKLHGLPTEDDQGAIPGQQAASGAAPSATQSQANDNSEASWRGGAGAGGQPMNRKPILDMTPRPLPIAPTFGKRADAGATPADDQTQSFDAGGPVQAPALPISGQLPPIEDEHAVDMNRVYTGAYEGAERRVRSPQRVKSYAPGGAVEDDPQTMGAIPADQLAGGQPQGDAPASDFGSAGQAVSNFANQDHTNELSTSAAAGSPALGPQQYLSGEGAASNDRMSDYLRQAAAHPDEGTGSMFAIAAAKTPQDGWAAVQNLRKNYNHETFLAKAALNGANGNPPNLNAAVVHANAAAKAFPDGNKLTWERTGDGNFIATVKFPSGPNAEVTKSKPEASYQLTPAQMNEYQDQGKAGQFDALYENGIIATLDRISKGPGVPVAEAKPTKPTPTAQQTADAGVTNDLYSPSKVAEEAGRRFPMVTQEGKRKDMQREIETAKLERQNKVDITGGIQAGKKEVAEVTGKSREASATIKGQSNENVADTRAEEMSKRTDQRGASAKAHDDNTMAIARMNLQSHAATSQDQMDMKMIENGQNNLINGVAKSQDVQDAEDRIWAKHNANQGGGQGGQPQGGQPQGAPAAPLALGQDRTNRPGGARPASADQGQHQPGDIVEKVDPQTGAKTRYIVK